RARLLRSDGRAARRRLGDDGDPEALETRLADKGFARSHRSTLVNLARLRELRPLSDGAWRLTLDSGAELVVSRSYRDGFLARLGA
ncbi:MAG: LytTR family transcriptional regulator, partial [Brevundimonas sp.]